VNPGHVIDRIRAIERRLVFDKPDTAEREELEAERDHLAVLRDRHDADQAEIASRGG
jgi:hypothetical protein